MAQAREGEADGTGKQIEHIAGAGLGLRTSTALPADTAVLTVPETLFLWKQSAGAGGLRVIFAETSLGSWTALLIQIFYESLQPASPWAEYFAILPPVFDQPIFWVR